jgi:hypothetical protein
MNRPARREILDCADKSALWAARHVAPGKAFWMLPFSMIVGLVLALAIAWPFHRFAEIPSIHVGHWVSTRLKASKRLAPGQAIVQKNAIKPS